MSEVSCPVVYDHNDDLDECMVCGWTMEVEKLPAAGPKDMTNMTGPQRIQEAIDRLSGRYAPTKPVLFAHDQPLPPLPNHQTRQEWETQEEDRA